MRRAFIVIAVAACTNRQPTSASTVTVIALAGEAAEGGVTVLSHDAMGNVFDNEAADATGTAIVNVDIGSLITVVYPGEIVPTTQTLSVITTIAPAAGGTITIHGPPDPGVAVVAGALTIAPETPIAATNYSIELGCNVIAATMMPDSFDVIAPCEGSDTLVDALVLAYDSSTPPQLLGYVAGEADLSQGDATLTPAMWSTTGTQVPVTLDGVAPTLDWAQIVDGLPYGQGPLGASGTLFTGLNVDAAVVHATMGGVVTTLEIANAPTAISFSTTDFPLPAITPSLSLADLQTLSLTWSAPSVTAAASDVQLAWMGPMQQIVWDIVVSSDVTAIAFPQLGDDDLATSLVFPIAASDITASQRFISSTDVPDFATLATAGLYVESTNGPSAILPTPTAGEIFSTSATGFAQ